MCFFRLPFILHGCGVPQKKDVCVVVGKSGLVSLQASEQGQDDMFVDIKFHVQYKTRLDMSI